MFGTAVQNQIRPNRVGDTGRTCRACVPAALFAFDLLPANFIKVNQLTATRAFSCQASFHFSASPPPPSPYTLPSPLPPALPIFPVPRTWHIPLVLVSMVTERGYEMAMRYGKRLGFPMHLYSQTKTHLKIKWVPSTLLLYVLTVLFQTALSVGNETVCIDIYMHIYRYRYYLLMAPFLFCLI